MSSATQAAAVLDAVDERERASQCVVSAFVHTATLEFQAALQLLVERARFVSGARSVAIALEQDGQFVYSAASGESAPETGVAAGLSQPSLRDCIGQRKIIRSHAGGDFPFGLNVPILREGKAAGFLELHGGSAFEDRDCEAVQRIAEMIDTAIDHRDAAALADQIAFEEIVEIPNAPATPSTWHAPNVSSVEATRQQQSSAASIPETAAAVPVQNCLSCGFPVSPGRKLCVDCERNTDPAQVPDELFTGHQHESWISTHGYTIASVLVSLLAIATILWLHAR
jgi:GAF domain-containing protein